jgi:tetratricopeptide (TPR) repeat protein
MGKRAKILGWLLGAFLCGQAPIALAQPSSPKASTPELEKAKKLYQEGKALFDKGKYEEALSSFRESYVLSGQPLLLVNMGQCYRNLKRYSEALEAFQTFLKEAPDSPQQKEVEKFVKEVEALAPEEKNTQPNLATKTTKASATELNVASQRLKEGRSFFARGQYTQALGLFRDAYFLSSDPLILIDLGQAYQELGLLSQASEAYRAFLRDSPNSLRRSEVEGYIKKIEALLPPTSNPVPASAPVTVVEVPAKTSRARLYFFGAAGLGGVGALSAGGFASLARRSVNQQNDLSVEDENGDGIISAQEISAKQNAIKSSTDNALLFGRIAAGFFIGAAISAGVGIVSKTKEKKAMARSSSPSTTLAKAQ